MAQFDFTQPAELFHPLRKGRHSPLAFHRFDTSAEAVKFAVEELTAVMFLGAVLEVAEGERFDSTLIQALYDCVAFPLGRS